MGPYLVTGGAGFIGSHLVDALLAAGFRVRVLDDLSTGKRANLDPRAELIVGNVADPVAVRNAMRGAVGCFHLAAIASVARGNEDWCGTHAVNVGGTVAVLDAARRCGNLPVVYASSAAIYGDAGEGRIAESVRPSPRSAYGADKMASELHAQAGFGVHGVPSIGFRFFNVYGPRQDPSSPYSGVISIFADRIASGRPITIHGDGGQVRDFVYVADVVRHLMAGMSLLHDAPRAAVANVCTGRATTIRDLADAIGRAAGRKPMLTYGAGRPGDIRSSIGDARLATSMLGVAAKTTLDEGLAATLDSLQAPRAAA